MPAPVETKDKPELMWAALKRHILRERERKKQEREAEVEEERLRKEREAREQQDSMTLGETREQIGQLETKLTQLKEEKHQLFLQLKKVLNEDDNRRRQKESNENMISTQTHAPGLVHQQIYMPPVLQRSAVPPVGPPPVGFKTNIKRQRTPSPPLVVPNSLYNQGYAYKPPSVPNAYQASPQRTPQYATQPPGPPSGPTSASAVAANYYNPHDLPLYSREAPPTPTSQRSLFEQQQQQLQRSSVVGPPASSQPPQVVSQASYHLEPTTTVAASKTMDHYAAAAAAAVAAGLRPPPPSHNGGALQTGTASSPHVMHVQQQSPLKSSGITTGYPVRGVTYQPQQVLYSPQVNRPLYQSSAAPGNGQPLNYPPSRD